jgi:hypothetical protein
MAKRQTWQVLSWIIAGSLIGFGLLSIDIFFISIPCLVIGLSLIIFKISRQQTDHLWVAFFCLGVIPTLFLLNDIISAYPFCPLQGSVTLASPTPGTTVSCGFIPATYYILLVCFSGIAFVSGIWPILRKHTHRSGS